MPSMLATELNARLKCDGSFRQRGFPPQKGSTATATLDYKRPGAAWNDVFVVTTGGEARAHAGFGVGYGKLYALNACAIEEKSRVRWLTNATDLPHNSGGGYSLGSPTVTGGLVYVGTDEGHLLVLADPSVAPGIGFQCADVTYTTAASCAAANYSLVPIPKLLADIAMPMGAI